MNYLQYVQTVGAAPIIETTVQYYVPRRIGHHAAGLSLALKSHDEYGDLWLASGDLRLDHEDIPQITVLDEDGKPVDPEMDGLCGTIVMDAWEVMRRDGHAAVID